MYKEELLTIVSITCVIGIVLVMIYVRSLLIQPLPTCTVTDLVNREIVVCVYKDKVLFHKELEK